MTRPCCLILLLIILLTGCGGEDAEPTATPPASPQTILASASQRLAETETVNFNLEVEGQTFIDEAQEIALISAAGDLERPNRVRVEFQVRLFGVGTVTIQLVTVGDQSWTTDLLTGDWTPAPEEFAYDPSILFDNQDGLGPVLGKVTDPELVGTEELGGREAFHISAVVEETIIGPLTGETMRGTPVTVDVWIDQETSDLLRIILVEPPSPEKEDPATWTMTIRGHNQQVDIEPPI